MRGLFGADVIITVWAAWLLACAGGHTGRGWLESGLAWAWSGVALVAGSGVIVGMTGGFGRTGFLIFHSAVLVGTLILRRSRLGTDWTALCTAGRQLRQFFNRPGPDRWLGLALGTILGGLAVISAWAEPEVVDALNYHLPRIGHWLQEGKIQIIGATDARMDCVAVLPEVVMAWLLGATREGFGLVVFAQAFGGIMTVGATVGLARQSGLGRTGALLAGGLLLGMGNVVVQFTAAQTDLFTTGVLAVSFYLWLGALRRGEGSVMGGLGAGLALGAKGTLFYLVPSAVLWVGWLAVRHRLPWCEWRRTLVSAAVGVAFFAAPGLGRNWLAYGDIFGPPALVSQLHAGFDSASGQLHKVYWNITSSLAQNFEPHSQPAGLRGISREIGMAFAGGLPENDAYTEGKLDRKERILGVLQRRTPDADVTSFGVVAMALFCAGTILAGKRWWRCRDRLIFIWSLGVVGFVFFLLATQQWHPFGFRYFVLVAPWVAVVSAWGIEQLGRRWCQAVWTLVSAGALSVCWHVTTQTHQAGWQAVTRNKISMTYLAALGWREWSQDFDHADEPFRLALPYNRPLGAFYRQSRPRRVIFGSDPGWDSPTAEAFVRGETGWIIVPAALFAGREGRVLVKTWLFQNDVNNELSLAAYRLPDSALPVKR